MPEIREIQIRSLDIPPVPDWLMQYPQAIPPVVPVTQNIGTPIVDMPGHMTEEPNRRTLRNSKRFAEHTEL